MDMPCSILLVVTVLAFAGFHTPVEANVFLGRIPAQAGVSKEDVELERTLLSQIEGVLGSEHRVFTEKRLDSIKRALSPIFSALPKNSNGKLEQAAGSYALHRIFVQRHAWFVKGLEPFKALSEWNSTSPVSVIDQRVPAYVTGLFNTSLGEHGLGFHELSVLAATIEHLIHKESLLRLSAAYRSLRFSDEDVLSKEEGGEVMDTYMAMYILAPLVHNFSNVSAAWVRLLRANITDMYPTFPETQRFVQDVSETVAPARDYLYYSDMSGLVEEVGERYGRWQDYECRALKDMLVEMEDQGTGGAGRVRLADFYKARLHDGKWQFSENIDYLRTLGALDESSPDNLRVIIPNYINSPSNCVASSSYYSVCCISECEEIHSYLESKIAAPEATPIQIAKIIARLPSSTLPGNRTLSPWLLRRLDDVAEHHGGPVPLHGRLLAQWLHYAYPRECPYPHVMGSTSPQPLDEYARQTGQDSKATVVEMEQIIGLPVPRQKRAEETGDMKEVLELESAMWSMEEELVAGRPSSPRSAKWPCLRALAFALAVLSAAFSLVQSIDRNLSDALRGSRTEKCFV